MTTEWRPELRRPLLEGMLNPVNINMSQVAWVLVVIVLIVILIKIL